MTIEFNCPHCDKTLKTSDDKAGRQAKCPGCGEAIDVPHPIDSMDTIVLNAEAIEDRASDIPPPESKSSDATKQCPMCGETIKAAAIRCRFCREILDDAASKRGRRSERREMRPFPPGEAISDAWRIYMDNMGLLFGSSLVMGLLTLFALGICGGPAVLGSVLSEQGNDVGAIVAWGVAIVLLVVVALLNMYFLSGYHLLQLRVIRGERAELGDLFSGGRFAGRMFISMLLFNIVIFLGFAACFVPGLFLTVMYFPFTYVLVDEDSPGIRCLSRAKELTAGNWGSIFIVFLVAWASLTAGAMCVYLGLIFATPFVSLLMAVSYDRMKCQTPINSVYEDPSLARRDDE